MNKTLVVNTDRENVEEVYVIPSKDAFNEADNTVRMYIQYANINEWVALPLSVSKHPTFYKLVNCNMALDKHGNLSHSPFKRKVYPIKQCNLDEYIFHMSNENNQLDPDEILNFCVWEAYTAYINSPNCNQRRQEKIKRKHESEFWCY